MKLSIAIPDSSLKDEKKHENKTRKNFNYGLVTRGLDRIGSASEFGEPNTAT